MRKLLVLVVSALAVAAALAASGSAFAAGGDAPRRDGGRGVWFTRVCAIPGAALGACGAQVVTNSGGTPLAGGAPAPTALGPAQFHSAYGLPTTAPTPQTIAIVDAYDHPNIESDLATFSSFYGLPPCTTANGCFRKVNQAAARSIRSPTPGWALEISLDVETAHAICQNCKILLVEATRRRSRTSAPPRTEAVALGANVISNSWGATEYFSETLDQNRYFNHPGVVITASTGDNGYEVQFPAASQYVTAVGGTTLRMSANGSWARRRRGTARDRAARSTSRSPSWQNDAGCSGRTVADVSADADPNTGAAVYDSVTYVGQSGWFQVGGTSLAAPLIAVGLRAHRHRCDGQLRLGAVREPVAAARRHVAATTAAAAPPTCAPRASASTARRASARRTASARSRPAPRRRLRPRPRRTSRSAHRRRPRP